MNAGIRRVGILCGVLVFVGAAALVLSGEFAPARPDGGVQMVEQKTAPAGDGGACRAALSADGKGEFSQSAQAPVGEGVMGRAAVLVSEPMLDAADKRPVRSVAIIVSVMKDARLLHDTHDLRSAWADGSEALMFAASAVSPAGESGGDEFSYELLIRPRDGLTWGETGQCGDPTIEITRCAD